MIGQMEFTWKTSYVRNGTEPDNLGRWLLNCYIHVRKEVVQKSYSWNLDGIYQDDYYVPVRIASIRQKGCLPEHCPSLEHKFCACIPSFNEALNDGLSREFNFFSNDLEELKREVEQQFEKTRDYLINAE